MAIVLKPLQCLTAAPEDYDYGWMRTVAYNVAKDERGRSLRLAQNEDEWHFDNQVMRYGSGMCLTYATQERVDEAVKYGFLVECPDPTPVFYHTVSVEGFYARPVTQENLDRGRQFVSRVDRLGEGPAIKTECSMRKYYVRIVGEELNKAFLALLAEYDLKPE